MAGELNLPANEALQAFLDHLEGERRASPRTREAYRRDLAAFFGFLAGHQGGTVRLADLAALKASDFRAYLAHRRKDADGLGARSIARALSAIRSFYRYGERRWRLKNDDLHLVKGPRIGKSLPKPVSLEGARALINETAPAAREPWIAARDAALITLLYGAGLRLSEALVLTGGDRPLAKSLRIQGKGGKMRLVPVLPAAREAVEAYAAASPWDLGVDEPLFRGARGGPMGPRTAQKLMANLRRLEFELQQDWLPSDY